jgi:uncharacterized protein YbjT (DUF2867 family)
MNTAIVAGATGLVGNQLTRQLLKDSRIEKVVVLTRRPTGLQHSKLEEHIVNFNAPDTWKKLVAGDILYSALGTTLRAAGSKEAQYQVDHTYQLSIAKAAAANGVSKYVLVSAAGSSTKSTIFYSRMKGELERDVQKLPFETIHILRPGMLKGERKNTRTGEIIGGAIMEAVSYIPGLGNLKPIAGHEVARAMINASFRHVVGIHIYGPGDLLKMKAM